MLQAVCMQFTNARSLFTLHLWRERERERDLRQRSTILIPKRIQRLKCIRAQEVSDFGIITMPVSYLATRPPANSSGRMSEIRKRTSVLRTRCFVFRLQTQHLKYMSLISCVDIKRDIFELELEMEFKIPDNYTFSAKFTRSVRDFSSRSRHLFNTKCDRNN